MIKVIEDKGTKTTISMSEMKPLQVGRIVSKPYNGQLVMRTQSTLIFEVMNLSDPAENACWGEGVNRVEVELLIPGEKVTIEITGE